MIAPIPVRRHVHRALVTRNILGIVFKNRKLVSISKRLGEKFGLDWWFAAMVSIDNHDV
jgi:hypothetical protein